ncbi:MAG: O-antigen ligase family protein [Proteobacteria bacterium]|nr:O-antigen ligase family protein [Pseudomonadota bacterium]
MTTNISWALAYVVAFVIIAARPNRYLSLARSNAIFLAAGLFAMLSALWSLTPSLSAYFGMLFLLNVVVGIVIAECFGISAIIRFIFWFCFLIQIASIVLALGHSNIAIDPSGNVRGLYSTKNVLAMYACILEFTSVLLLFARWRPLLCIAGIVLAFFCVILSRSGTGALLFVFVSGVATCCYIMVRTSRLRLFAVGLGFILIAIAGTAIVVSGINLSTDVLEAVGKDSTLTGRTELWDKALQSFDSYPWFGLGYLSYWYSPQTEAAEIWILTGQELYSFHNVYLDRLVDVGLIGLSLFVGGFLVLFWRSTRLLFTERTVTWAWCLTFICFLAALGMSEYPIFWNSEFQLVLSIIAGATCKIRLRSVERPAIAPLPPGQPQMT